MVDTILIFVLLASLLAMQIYYTSQTHKFVDKIMSRSFMEYQRAVEIPKVTTVTAAQFKPEYQEGDDINRIG